MFFIQISDFIACKHCGTPLKTDSTLLNSAVLDHCKECPYVERPDSAHLHVCILCNYHSFLLERMKRHIRTHTGEKPFQCPHCNYKSNRKDHVVTHVRIKH